MKEKIAEIKALIAADELPEAFVQIKEILSTHKAYNDVILQEARFNEVRKLFDKGILDFKETSLTKSQVRASMLELLDNIDPEKKIGKVLVTFREYKIETTISPIRLKTTTTYTHDPLRASAMRLLSNIRTQTEHRHLFGTEKVNRGWCVVEIIVENVGIKVLDNWKLKLKIPENVKCVEGVWDNPTSLYEALYQSPQSSLYGSNGIVLVTPDPSSPLIQKDIYSFKISVLPNLEIDEFNIEWEFLARDFSKTGFLIFKVIRQYKEVKNKIFVETPELQKEEIVEITEFIEEDPCPPPFLVNRYLANS